MECREKKCAFHETLNIYYTVLYNLFEPSSYKIKKKKEKKGGKKRLISSAIMEIKGLVL